MLIPTYNLHQSEEMYISTCFDVEKDVPIMEEIISHVFVDSKKSDLSSYESCIIKINKLEFNKLKKQPKQCELIVTMGEQGARWNDKVYPTEACDVFDVCGAGDTFLAALVYEQLATDSIEKGIQFANHCSRLVVGKFGTYALTTQDVEDIRNKGEDQNEVCT